MILICSNTKRRQQTPSFDRQFTNSGYRVALILTNRKSSFKDTVTIETGLSDFHVMILTVLKGRYVKSGPKIITYRDYSKFGAVDFNSHLAYVLACGLCGGGDYGVLKLSL